MDELVQVHELGVRCLRKATKARTNALDVAHTVQRFEQVHPIKQRGEHLQQLQHRYGKLKELVGQNGHCEYAFGLKHPVCNYQMQE